MGRECASVECVSTGKGLRTCGKDPVRPVIQAAGIELHIYVEQKSQREMPSV